MALIRKKTRKKLRKAVWKLARKHGQEVAAGLVLSVVRVLITDPAEEAVRKAFRRRGK